MTCDAAELFDGADRFALTLTSDDDPGAPSAAVWLSAAIEVRQGSRAWREEDSCLTRDEVERLAAWIESGCEGEFEPFREGSLAFDYRAPSIHITLDLEFAPPDWETPGTPFEMQLPLDQDQARAFGDAVRAQLAAIDRGDDGVSEGPPGLIP